MNDASRQAPPTGERPAAPDWAEAVEARLLDAAVRLAPSVGWNDALLAAAAREAGLAEGEARLVAPRGARDLAALLWRRHDAAAMTRLSAVDPVPLKIRERIRTAVEARLDAAWIDEAAERKASPYLALPGNAPLALRLAWSTADQLWRWAGDVATDENHYSKRALLAAILISTGLTRLARGRAASQSHLAARIDGVMRFERWKAGLPQPSALALDLAARLGRLRYGAAPAPAADVLKG